jgi:hypothetical protein
MPADSRDNLVLSDSRNWKRRVNRIIRIAAPFEPASVVDTDARPIHQPGIEERQRGAPTGAAVEGRERPGMDAAGAQLAQDLFGRTHAAFRLWYSTMQ